jgi:hypothetical protein
MAGGRPPKFKTAADLGEAIEDYFADCEKRERWPTVAGLQVALDLWGDNFLKEQARRGEEFSKIIKRARAKMFDEKFQAAASGRMDKTIFIFDAVNNHDHVNTRTDNKNKNEHTGKDGAPLGVAIIPAKNDTTG